VSNLKEKKKGYGEGKDIEKTASMFNRGERFTAEATDLKRFEAKKKKQGTRLAFPWPLDKGVKEKEKSQD